MAPWIFLRGFSVRDDAPFGMELAVWQRDEIDDGISNKDNGRNDEGR
jgi:hypothetical protein